MRRRTGPILRVTPVEAGSISDFAAVLDGRDGLFFCKGAVAGNPMGWMHRNEDRINPYLPAEMPRLHWQIEIDGWLLLGFEYVEGRYPDLSPARRIYPRSPPPSSPRTGGSLG
nr:hypothetical protein GCM10020092_062670 [Actinoplanes digitatis]